MSKKPILQKELEKALGITGAQINYLCDRFDVSKLDLADVCGHTLNTFYTYMTGNAEKMPQETQDKVIAYFLGQFRSENQGYVKKEEPPAEEIEEPQSLEEYGKEVSKQGLDIEKKEQSGDNEQPSEELDIYDAVHEFRKENGYYDNEENQHPESSTINQESKIPTYPHIDQRFKYLSFEAITFRPKNGSLGDALNEAADYSREAGVPVHVKDNGRNFKIECVEE